MKNETIFILKMKSMRGSIFNHQKSKQKTKRKRHILVNMFLSFDVFALPPYVCVKRVNKLRFMHCCWPFKSRSYDMEISV